MGVCLDYNLYSADCRARNVCYELFQDFVERLAILLTGCSTVQWRRYLAGSDIQANWAGIHERFVVRLINYGYHDGRSTVL